MRKLAAWSIDPQSGENAAQPALPQRIGRSHVGLERQLEDWIVNDVTLIAEGVTLVGRQIVLDDGRLDLLAIDSQDRWVVIEVKPGLLYAGALTQALYYASSLARLSPDEILGKIESGLGAFGDANRLLETVKQQLEGEEQGREIAVMLVGAGIHPGLERMNEFLGGFGVPIRVVSFDVFEVDGGPKLLVREVVEEPPAPPAPRRRLTVERIRRRAVDVGVGAQFDRFVEIAKAAGLAVQPQRASVRIAPPTNRTRFLMYASPRAGAAGGELRIHVSGKALAEFFPEQVDEREASKALRGFSGRQVGGEALDEILAGIERFLTDKLQPRKADTE